MPAVLCVVGLGLTGCTGEPEPSTTTQVTTSATPSPTPSPTPAVVTAPERPAAMATASADGAAAAASYFISLYPYVYATGDLAEWDALSGPDCAFCSSTREGVDRVRQKGGNVAGGEIAINSVDGSEIEPGRWYAATVIATEAPSAEYDMYGVPVEESQGGDYKFSVALTFASGAWTVDAVDVGPAAP